MFKVSNRFSVNLSITISILFFMGCIAGLFMMPALVDLLINTPDGVINNGNITRAAEVAIMIATYLIVAVFIIADVFMFFLLTRVKKSLVFTEISVSLIRKVSWCCFIVCLLFVFLGIYFKLSFIIAFLGAFLGICLRVVKNVIAQATEIKEENDLTV